jgi:peptide/nickel transport system permease protein
MILGLSIGVIAGWYRRKWPDKLGSTVALMLYSMPSFWIGMILIYLFAVTFQIFPAGGISSLALLGGDPIEVFMANLKHLTLPLITYSLIFAGQYALLLRSSMVNVLSEDYILTAKAKGLRDLQVLRSHAMKNAALPATTIITMNLGAMVLGSISVETVFNWPGIGLLIYSSIGRRDYPMLQGAMIVFIFIMILANFIADLLYAFLDPRIRY